MGAYHADLWLVYFNLVAGTSPTNSSHEGFEGLVAGTSPTNSNQFEFVGQVAGTKFWSPRLDFLSNMAGSHDGTCPRDLLRGLVPGTSPLVCADLKATTAYYSYSYWHGTPTTVALKILGNFIGGKYTWFTFFINVSTFTTVITSEATAGIFGVCSWNKRLLL